MRRILFVLATGYLPDTINGANRSLHALCLRLVSLGIEPVVIAAPDAPAARPAAEGDGTDGGGERRAPGYTVLRHLDTVEALREAAARLRPDAVVLHGPEPAERAVAIADAILPDIVGRRLHVYFTTGFFGYAFPTPIDAPHLRYAANSPFLARRGRAYFGVPVAMVPSVVEPDAYRCAPAGDRILFVNPVAMKGVHIVGAIADRLAHRRFLIVPARPDHPGARHVSLQRPNVEWTARTGDMRPLYARTRLVLMPSVCEESSGRAVGEAQVSGIPAVASDRGGLRDSIGPGGVCLPLGAPIAEWCAAIEMMFDDPARYAAYAQGALAQAARPDFQPARAVQAFLDFVAT